MTVGGASTFEKEDISVSIPPLLLPAERERPKTSIRHHSLSRRRQITADIEPLVENGQQPIYIIERRSSSVSRSIPNETVFRHTGDESHRQSVPSKCSIGTQTIVENVRQPAFLEAYRPPVIVERIDKRPSTGKRHREKNRLDETEHKVRSDLPPANNFSSDISYTNHDPFNPEFCRQRKAAIDNMEYRRIIVSWKAKSLNEVVSLMKELSIGKSYIDRAWIVFYWVSQNIEYDVNSYFSGDIRHQTPDDVFRNKSGVCDAYGSIFKALCDGVQLENVKISGYAKGYGYIPGRSTFTKTDHAWNVVRLDKQWYLIDSTWGAGHTDQSDQYKKCLCPHYFLTRPEQMIYDHFPEDSRWQLLPSTVSMQQFIALPYVHPAFFDLQLEIISSRQTNMATFDTERNLAEVLIRAPSNVDLSCSIAHGKTSGLAQYDTSRKLWQCLFRPQRSGYQTLDIYAREVQSSKTYESAIEFGLDMPHVIRFEGFPLTYSNFSTNKCQIFEPLADKLRRGSKVTIHCRIPGARCVRLAFDGTFSSQEQTIINDIFKQQITVPKREIVVYVQFANSKKSHSYEGLFKYAVE